MSCCREPKPDQTPVSEPASAKKRIPAPQFYIGIEQYTWASKGTAEAAKNGEIPASLVRKHPDAPEDADSPAKRQKTTEQPAATSFTTHSSTDPGTTPRTSRATKAEGGTTPVRRSERRGAF